MSNGPQRPNFFEGQILAANDLQLSVQSARAGLARHGRYLHTWGIAEGLQLTPTERETGDTPPKKYVDVTLSPGLAVDGTGREIVVSESERLSPTDFLEANLTAGQQADAYYPVFLLGQDQAPPLPPLSAGACAAGGTTRTLESYRVGFGRPGEAADFDQQDLPDLDEGPGDGQWKVLLGFVQWNGTDLFTSVKPANLSNLRYAGVRADDVEARGGALTLRTTPRAAAAGKPGFVVDETDDGRIAFGPQTPSGAVEPVFTVNMKGDVIAKGTIQAKLTSGAVHIASGVATDGAILPLPEGVTEDQVSGGQAVLHVHVTPRLSGFVGAGAGTIVIPIECRVDPPTRRVLCSVWRFFSVPVISPGACDYTIMAWVPPPKGDQ